MMDCSAGSSCPGLTRASTPFVFGDQDVDGRAQASGSDAVLRTAMPGHDDVEPSVPAPTSFKCDGPAPKGENEPTPVAARLDLTHQASALAEQTKSPALRPGFLRHRLRADIHFGTGSSGVR